MTLSPCLKTLPSIYDAISFLRGESPEEQRQRFFKASFPCPDQPPPDHPYWQEADEPEEPPSPAGPQAHLFAGFLKDPAFTTGQAPFPDHITAGWQAPTGADCLTVLLMLQLAQAHQNAAEPAERLRDPGHILVIRVPGLDLIEPVQRAASLLWRSILKAEQIWGQPPADASQLVKADAERELVEIILTGKSAVAILDRTSTLPQPLRPFILSEILLPLSDRATMAATLALTHSIAGPERARAFDHGELDVLPEDTLPGKMSGLQLGVAFGQKTMSKIIDRLHTFAASPLPGSGKKYPQLRDVYGQAEGKSFCAALIRDLDLWQKGQLDWRDVTATALLYGPPDTGKSMLPQALANSAGL